MPTKSPIKPRTKNRIIKYPCNQCHNSVAKNHRGILCDVCNTWVHASCNNTSIQEYIRISAGNNNWSCLKCINGNVPFSSMNSDSINKLYEGKPAFSLFDSDINNERLRFLNSLDSLHTPLDDPDTDENPLSDSCKYYTTEEFKNSVKKKHSKNSFLHLNIASLSLHFSELKNLLKQCEREFDFIGITETGLKQNDGSLELEGYKPVDCYTEASRGGVRIYIKKGISFKPRPDLDTKISGKLETKFIEVVDDNTIVGCIYKHPNMSMSEFKIYYTNVLEKLCSKKSQSFLMGDFNIDLLKSNSHTDTSNFLEQNLSSCIRPFILRPTRITPHSKTLIDNIYSNYLEDNYLSGNIISAISDHLPQFLLTGTSHDLPKTKPPRKITFKDYKNFDRQNLILDFIGTDWEEKFQNKSPEHKMSTLIEETNKIIDNNTPSKTIKNNRKHIKQDPWVTAGLLKSIITKDNLL